MTRIKSLFGIFPESAVVFFSDCSVAGTGVKADLFPRIDNLQQRQTDTSGILFVNPPQHHTSDKIRSTVTSKTVPLKQVVGIQPIAAFNGSNPGQQHIHKQLQINKPEPLAVSLALNQSPASSCRR
jgi:hypothetical protein